MDANIDMNSPQVEGVSYLITVYNQEKYIEEIITSLMAQQGDFQKEIVVVDDGSMDNSLQIINQALSGYEPKKIIQQVNSGQAYAFNVGVKAAKFPFVKFVDGDNIIFPDATLKLLAHMADENVALVIAMGTGYAKYLDEFVGAPFKHLDRSLEFVVRTGLSSSSEAMVRRADYLDVGGCDDTLFIQVETYIHRLSLGRAIVLTSDVVVRGLRTGEPGLNDNSLQIEHDRNAAFIGLLQYSPDMPTRIKRTIFRRAAKRAWRWARNVNKTAFACDPVFWLILLSYLPWTPAHETLVFLTLGPYQKSGGLRVGGGHTEAPSP